MTWGMHVHMWQMILTICVGLIAYRAMAGRMIEIEADNALQNSNHEVHRRRIDVLENEVHTNRKIAEKTTEMQRDFISEMSVEINALRARLREQMMTPEERQERMQAWMAEAARLNIDLSRIMKDLA